MNPVPPLTIAEIFDRAVTLVVRRWSTAAAIALIASIPATLSQALWLADPFVRRDMLGGVILLQLLTGVVLIFAFAALALLFSGAAEDRSALELYREAFGSFWRLLGVALASGFVAALVVALAVFLSGIGLAIGGFAGLALVLLAVLLLTAPLLFVAQLALANAVLEEMGVLDALDSAFSRSLLFGAQRRRTYLLALAVMIAYLAPRAIVTGTLAWVAVLTQQRWLLMLTPALVTLFAFVFVSAIVTVAALDYRVRAEGDDLEAVLDAAVAT
jgi:hypothetical protein